MKNPDDREEVLKELGTLDKITWDLFTELKAFSPEELNRVPEENVWSVMQVLNHVLLSERGSFAYVKKKLSFDPQLKKAGFVTSMRWVLLKAFLYSPFKFKAPKGVGTANLPKTDNLGEIIDTWISHRSLLREYILELEPTRFSAEIYKHPLAGRLTIDQMIKFFIHHLQRHSRQIRQRLPQKKFA